MEKNKSTEWITYRSKGPDGARTMCALMFSVPLLQMIGNPERCSIEIDARQGSPWNMYIRPTPSGYKINFKRPGSMGELNVSWSILDAAPRDATGKGRLPVRVQRTDDFVQLVVDISTWRDKPKQQETLFGVQGRELKPS